MNISYAIPVCNEYKEIKNLISSLLKIKNKEDEIVVLFDSKNGTKEVRNYLKRKKGINFFENDFEGHFAEMKNILTQKCTKDYIFQIDADELIHVDLPKYLPVIFKANPDIEVYRVGRINKVEGLTLDHVHRWGWTINEKGHINFPDFQWRIYKNNKKIIWKNKVHENLIGYEQYTELPPSDVTCLIHNKTIDRQEKQNNYYNTL
jgi:hypothetical protein|tara:strand:+ start:3195 stop:3809 length:615 start_codon:yes stop_codon:yes gene_type:complete